MTDVPDPDHRAEQPDHGDPQEHGHGHDHGHGHAERFVPEEMGGRLIAAEHEVRYRLALDLAPGRRVLDAGCGVGWGSLLLHEAGASSVVGLDIAEEALADARRRAPACEFVPGDLQSLPFGDDEFDLVVCLEALEHAADTSATLDELARVLRPDGVLVVSSPNPGVYPDDNPFHLHELTPEELHAGLGARFPQVRLLRQHTMLASALVPDGPDHPGALEPFDVRGLAVAPLAVGRELYSVAVASAQEVAPPPAWVGLAPPTEFDHLVAERRVVLARIDDAEARLREADTTVRGLIAARDEALQRLSDVETRWRAADAQLRNLRLATDNAAAERDELVVRLLAAEQQLAGVPRRGLTVPLEELVAAEAEAVRLASLLRKRRGKAVALREENKRLRARARRARLRAERAESTLAERQASLLRRAARRLPAGRGRP